MYPTLATKTKTWRRWGSRICGDAEEQQILRFAQNDNASIWWRYLDGVGGKFADQADGS
jgi:hypothetical protein